MGESRGSTSRIGRQARPSATATGTRSTSSRKKMPKRICAACPGERTLPPITPAGPALRRTRTASAMRSAWNSSHTRPAMGQAMWMSPERQLRQLADAVEGELGELPAPPQEDEGEERYEGAGKQLHLRLGARREAGEHVHGEMRAFAHRQHGAEHHRVDQAEARQLLRPDVGGDEGGVAREDLQADRHHQHGDRHDQQKGDAARQQPVHRAQGAERAPRRRGAPARRLPASPLTRRWR